MPGAEDHCGVAAVHGSNAARLTVSVLEALQHRGRESAGFKAHTTSGQFIEQIGMGTVREAINFDAIPFDTRVAIGHTRYSTTAGSSLEHAQPIGGSNDHLAFAHNGDVPNFVRERTDSAEMHTYLDYKLGRGHSIGEAMHALMTVADGAYSVVGLTREGTMFAARDPQGFKPLAVGRIGENIVFASETVAITHEKIPHGWKSRPDAAVLFDVKPGEMVWVDKRGNLSRKSLVQSQKITTCAFEYAYFSRGGSEIDGIQVGDFRFRMGEFLADKAAKAGIQADIVVPVLGSGEDYARGYAQRSGLPFVKALIKNSEERVFIGPDASKRMEIARSIHEVLAHLVRGKRLAVPDDSMVRGDTSTTIVDMLWKAGASEVHLTLGYWEVKWPCYEGIDFHNTGELIAAGRDVEDIRKIVRPTTLIFPTNEEFRKVLGRDDICDACNTGNHPLREATLRRIEEVGFKSRKMVRV